MSSPVTNPIEAARLRTCCDPATLGFESTSELKPTAAVVGQERAAEAIRFGIGMAQPGYNLFVLGPTGSGRLQIARTFIEQQAATQPVPNDYCYVHNFDDPRKPRALKLPPGQGARLSDQLERLVAELQAAIPALFESAAYRERREAIERELNERHEQDLTAIAKEAAQRGVAVLRTQGGFVLAPLREGKVLEPAEQEKLSAEERASLQREAEAIHARVHEALMRVPLLQREQREREHLLDQEMVRALVRASLSESRRAFGELPEVMAHLDAIERDLTDKATLVAQARGETSLPMAIETSLTREGPVLRRCRANLLVDHRLSSGAPVVVLDHPTSSGLVGKVEHISQFGILVTDFTLIKAGALHRANGGYLILDAQRLLMQPVSYEQLKRTLRAGQIRTESVAEALDLTASVSLEPEPIPFSAKVVLIGESWIYGRLRALDPEFDELFKVAADFETDMPRTPEHCRAYAELLARVLRREQLPPMRAAAMARMIDEAARQAEDSTKLSLHVRAAFDLLREAGQQAIAAGREVIEAQDIESARLAQERRHGRMRDRVRDAMVAGTIRIETEGAVAGQVNALTVAALATTAFGFPARVTASVRFGKGEVVDIEREVQLGGPIHSKGVMILGAVLGSRYLPNRPLSLRASLVFEQSYGFVEGDSASLAELLALLSAIGGIPLEQGIAVTGSLDQRGRVQAVGGVNEKIEGFFDICRARGSTGRVGVVIPAGNLRHLMLRQDVVAAATRGEFHVWAVSDSEQALELLSGASAGERAADGLYPPGSANRRVEDRLEAFARAALAAAKPPGPGAS